MTILGFLIEIYIFYFGIGFTISGCTFLTLLFKFIKEEKNKTEVMNN